MAKTRVGFIIPEVILEKIAVEDIRKKVEKSFNLNYVKSLLEGENRPTDKIFDIKTLISKSKGGQIYININSEVYDYLHRFAKRSKTAILVYFILNTF